MKFLIEIDGRLDFQNTSSAESDLFSLKEEMHKPSPHTFDMIIGSRLSPFKSHLESQMMPILQQH